MAHLAALYKAPTLLLTLIAHRVSITTTCEHAHYSIGLSKPAQLQLDMSQSRSQGRRAHTSSGFQPAVATAERAGSLGSTSGSQYSVQDIQDDIEALIKEVDRLGEEFIASTEEYKSSVKRVKKAHIDARSNIFTDYFKSMQTISLTSKPEDMKRQAYEELEATAQGKLDKIKKRLENRANEFGAEEPEMSRHTPSISKARHRAKADAIRKNSEEIKKVAGTPEGMQQIEICKAELAHAYEAVQINLRSSYEQYLTKMSQLTIKQMKIKGTLDKKGLRPEAVDYAEAAEGVKTLRTKEPESIIEGIEKVIKRDKRMEKLEK